MELSFSEKELSYLRDSDFLLTKSEITNKVIYLLGEVRQALKNFLKESGFVFPAGTDLFNGKISKGEKYKGLPYVVLDFPKLMQKENIFALRTMFWWSREWSCTLHLQGEVLCHYQENLLSNLTGCKNKEIWFCVNAQPWEYDYTENNYHPVHQITPDKISSHLAKNHFVKVSRRLELNRYQELTSFVLDSLLIFLELLGN